MATRLASLVMPSQRHCAHIARYRFRVFHLDEDNNLTAITDGGSVGDEKRMTLLTA